MEDNLKLLTAWTPLKYSKKQINESRLANNGKIMLKGVLQRCDTINQNGRIYPRSILESDHPDSSVIELKNASHIVREARMDGDSVIGSIEILDTPSGKIIQSLIDSGVTLGISSRGVGSTRREGNSQIVQDDYQLICFDMVSEPSTPGAFMIAEGKKITRSELDKHFTETDRIDRIFNEILLW